MLASACAKSEQCEYDLRLKMRHHGVDQPSADAVIDYLVEHQYLDEARYAMAFAKDKLRFNGWGRLKIAMNLRSKRIPQYTVSDAISAIDEDTYYEVLVRLVKSASRSLSLETKEDRLKLMRRLYSRGFEPDKVRDAIDDVRDE